MNKILIDLDSHFEFLSKYNDSFINKNLCNYLIEQCSSTNSDIEIELCFHYLEPNLDELEIQKRFYNSFKKNLNEIRFELKDSNVRCLFMFCLGVAASILYFGLSKMDIPVLSEFFLIVCWIAFGEIIEDFLFNRRKLIEKKKKYLILLNADINIVYCGDSL